MSPDAALLHDLMAVRPPIRVGLTAFAHRRLGTGRTSHDGLGDDCPPNLRSVGEILGWTSEQGAEARKWVINAWLDSPSHRHVLLDRAWRWIGVATTRTEPFTYFCAEFGR